MFYKNVIESSSDEESDDYFKVMMAAAMLLREHSSRPIHRERLLGYIGCVMPGINPLVMQMLPPS
jgi:hypothetical protein